MVVAKSDELYQMSRYLGSYTQSGTDLLSYYPRYNMNALFLYTMAVLVARLAQCNNRRCLSWRACPFGAQLPTLSRTFSGKSCARS
mgnify:FL=1